MILFDFKNDVIQPLLDRPEVISSLIICIAIAIICIIVKIKSKSVDPLKKPKGIMLIAEMAVEYCDNFVGKNMGKIFIDKFSPYIGFCFSFVILAFTIGLLGLPSPMTYFIVPLCLALFTFVLIHYISIKYTKLSYFKRYTDPIFLFLPINLISMWAPLISMSFRMFGNAVAGFVLMKLIYGVFQILSEMLFGGMHLPIAAIVTPFLHMYFDLFSAFIQALVFVSINMLFIANEVPDEIDVNNLENVHLS